MTTVQEHSVRVLKEHVDARAALDALVCAAAGALDPRADAVVSARDRIKAADRAYAADLEARGFSAPHGK